MPDTPPPIGFLPHYTFDQYAASHISGIDLSYDRQPIPNVIASDLPPNEIVNDDQDQDIINSSTTSADIINPLNDLQFDYSAFELIGYSWQHIDPSEPFPIKKAVRAGRDSDGSHIFVGRSFHEGDLLPAKVIPDKGLAFVSYGGEEVVKDDFEILRTGDFVWEFATNGEVPENAVEAGRTAEGEKLYFGRCLHEGTQTPGKVQASHGCLYIPFNGEEVAVAEYEVLVLK